MLLGLEDVAKALKIPHLTAAELERELTPALAMYVGGARHLMWHRDDVEQKYGVVVDG